MATVEPAKKRQFKLHIAVDFGTDGIGMAYAIDNEVFVHQKWNSKRYGSTVKPKTILLFDDEGGAAFGMDAKFTYMNLAETKQQKWMLFERFKMSLYDGTNKSQCDVEHKHDENDDNDDNDDEKQIKTEKHKIGINDYLTAINGKQCSSEKIFVAVFQHIQKESTKFLRKKRIRAKKHEIQWIITVPAIWSDKAKYTMKQWIMKAGLVNDKIPNQCKIVYEPDCASLAIQHEVYKEMNKTKGMICNVTDDAEEEEMANDEYFGKGHKYILIDAGGGTVDVACHEILAEFGAKEIYYPTGGPWGSCFIDDQYINLLEQIFGKEWMDEFKEKSGNTFVEMIHNFQEVKATFNHIDQGESHNCRLPDEFLAFLDEKLNGDDEDMDDDDDDEDEMTAIEDIVSTACILGKYNLVALNDEFLEIDVSVWRSMFDHVINPIIEHVEGLLNEEVMKGCKYLCLVGGLSCSTFFQYRMEETFGEESKYGMQLIIPQRPILTVVQGAAYFGITDNYIKSRRLAKTYGYYMEYPIEQALDMNIPSQHIEKYKYFNHLEEHWWVSHCFEVIVRKGDEVSPEKAFCINGAVGGYDRTMKVLCSDLKDPKIALDGQTVATYELPVNSGTTVVSEFHFGGEMMKASTYEPNNPFMKNQVELEYH